MTLRKTILGLIVFASGAVVLALEIVAVRFLQVKFGSAIYATSSVIGIFLGGLALGYFLGGHIADRCPTFLGFGVLLLITAALLASLPLYATRLRDAIFDLEMLDLENVERIGSLLASVALFLVPTTFLGMVSPYGVRLLADDPARLGRQVGMLYALSTTGSIVGAIGTPFVLLSELEMKVSHTFYLFGGVQLALAAIAIGFSVVAGPKRAKG